MLGLIAQISVTLAGFAALVALVDRSARDEWAEVAYWRVRNLIIAALSATLLCLLPGLLKALRFEPDTVWFTSNVVMLVWIGLYVQMAIRQRRAVMDNPVFSWRIFYGALTFMILCGAALVTSLIAPGWVSREGSYLATCILLLGMAVAVFAALVFQIIGGEKDQTNE